MSLPERGMKRSGSSKSRNRVVWNEQNLDFLEANKTPKQKINEPKTPYYAPEAEDGLVSPSPTDRDETVHMPDGDSHALHAEAIRNALIDVASTSADVGPSEPPNSEWVTSSEDEAEEMDHEDEGGFESNGRRWSFEEHRRAHYDEYRKAKMLAGHEMSDEEAEMGGGGEDGERHQPRGGGGGGGGGGGSRQSQQDHEASLSRSLGGIDLEAAEM